MDDDLYVLLCRQLAYAVDAVNEQRPAWQRKAACRGMNTRLWFSEPADKAKKICGACAVKAECLAYASQFGDNMLGVWGGLSGRERKSVKRGNVA
jgi:WhiB family redox-sensing transcriptional regulator